jgi:hypothetical protein
MRYDFEKRQGENVIFDRLVDGIRQTQEQFHGPRYWERPVETPGVSDD